MSASTVENTPVTITPSISDPDKSGTPRISAVTNPLHGTATFTGTAITYTPDRDYSGADSFRYTATDGTDSTQGTITVTIKSDAAPPKTSSVDLDQDTRTLTISFNEPVDVSEIDLDLLYVRDEDSSSGVSLSGASLDRNADSTSISIRLTDSQLNRINSLRNPQLEIGAGAVTDLARNEIPDASSRLAGTAPVTQSTAPAPRGGGGGGGSGGGGGGGSAAAPAEFAGLYSVMWDCNEPATTVILDSDLSAEIALIAGSDSFTPVPHPDQNLDGRTIYTAGAHAGIMLLKVSAGGSSTSKTINTLDRCIGQIEYSRYVPDTPSLIQAVSAQPAERDFAPVPITEQPDVLEPVPATEQAPAELPPAAESSVPAESDADSTSPAEPDAEDGGCLIATAAYGTELAPQVQMLRELRDSMLFSTDSGASFMDSFNSAYYLFSPGVADMLRESSAFRDAVRALITPMIHSLSIMSLAEENSEWSVLALGALVITLNLGMYLAAPATVAIVLARRLGMWRAHSILAQHD